MKKALLVLSMLFVANLSYAQTPRPASDQTLSHVGRTNFTTVGITGLDSDGSPGYIALGNATHSGNNRTEYYLWVNDAGNLCVASYVTLKNYASFPSGNWGVVSSMPCSKVGSQ